MLELLWYRSTSQMHLYFSFDMNWTTSLWRDYPFDDLLNVSAGHLDSAMISVIFFRAKQTIIVVILLK